MWILLFLINLLLVVQKLTKLSVITAGYAAVLVVFVGTQH